MSREQRLKVNTMLGRQEPEGPRPVEEIRSGFAAMMATMIVPDGIRTSEVTLGARRAVLVEPNEPIEPNEPRTGTILYFHGGGNVFGSPETAMSLTANLVVKTGFRSFSPRSPETPPAAASASRPACPPAPQGCRCPRRSCASPRRSTAPGRARAWTPKTASTRSSRARAWATPAPCTLRVRTRTRN
jgi:hypothetical protein